jgi:putative ABC transport system permease protein
MLPQTIRHALRTLRRAPAFTAAALVTLALGIGANVAIFSVAKGVLFSPLPFADEDRVIQLSNQDSPATLSEPEVVDLRRDARSFAIFGVYSYGDANITGDGDAERVRVARIDYGFFATLAPVFAAGRPIVAAEDSAGANDVVVISHGLWQRRYGGDSGIVGRQILLSNSPYTVVGVAPAHFDYPSVSVSVWVPLRLDRGGMVTRNNHYLRVVARLADSVDIASADAEMRALRDRWAQDYPESYQATNPLQMDVRPIRERIVGASQPYLIALLGAVGFVLLVACVNVASLILVRTEVRRHELTIRTALGATRRRLAMQLSAENALLALGGGVLGLAIAWPAVRALVALAPSAIPRVELIALDTGALAFAALVCVAVTAVFALIPLFSRRLGSRGSLATNARTAAQVHGRSARRLRSSLVVSEVALAAIMLAGAGVFVQMMVRLQRTDPGFATSGVFTARVTLPSAAYVASRRAAFVEELVGRVREMPGVSSAAAMAWLPIIEGGGNWSITPENSSALTVREAPTAAPQQVTPGFFETMGIALRRGRTFTAFDRAGGEPVAVVNEAFAKKVWQTTDVVGRRFRLTAQGSPFMTIVGVVADTRVDGLTEAAPPIMYFTHGQAATVAYFASPAMSLLVRSDRTEGALATAIREAVRELDASVPLSGVSTIGRVIEDSIARQRFTSALLTGLAVLALALAAIGTYGIVSYDVAQRRFEFGVRLALGAGAGRVFAHVLAEGLGVIAIGLLLGTAGAVVLSRSLQSFVVGVSPVDATTIVGVAALLLVVALLALVIPARRAMLVPPTDAMRGG